MMPAVARPSVKALGVSKMKEILNSSLAQFDYLSVCLSDWIKR